MKVVDELAMVNCLQKSFLLCFLYTIRRVSFFIAAYLMVYIVAVDIRSKSGFQVWLKSK